MKEWHKHDYLTHESLSNELKRSKGVITFRHRHEELHETSESKHEKNHNHNEFKIGAYDKIGIYKGNQVMPVRQKGFSLLQSLWPSWVMPHKWFDIMPFHQIWLKHSKRHYNSSGLSNNLAGGLTLLTQGFKISIIVAAYFLMNSDSSNKTEVYIKLLIAMLCMAALLLANWIIIWHQDISNCVISIINWWLYVNGWLLSAFTLFDRINPRGIALIPVLLPPVYVFLRTILFFPKETRREGFLLAAISNRSVPLGVNFHVVGPPETFDSHRFLIMLNIYSFFSTLISKGLVFGLETNLHPIVYVMHGAHLFFTLYSSLFQIRCRQIALDSFNLASKVTRNQILQT